jgi:hypothetical protein
MYTIKRFRIFIAASCLLGGNALAAAMTGDAIYEDVDIFSNSVHFTDNFSVAMQGMYKATLTDFEFPTPFSNSGLNVTTATDLLGEILGPGSFTFEAAPGDYFVSVFASVAGVSAEEKKRLVEAEVKERGYNWSHSLTKEQKQEHRDLWASLTQEEREAHREKVWKRAERRVEEQLAREENLGQYGVQIMLVDANDGSSTVPVPGALWLFITGLTGLVGFARKRGAC